MQPRFVAIFALISSSYAYGEFWLVDQAAPPSCESVWREAEPPALAPVSHRKEDVLRSIADESARGLGAVEELFFEHLDFDLVLESNPAKVEELQWIKEHFRLEDSFYAYAGRLYALRYDDAHTQVKLIEVPAHLHSQVAYYAGISAITINRTILDQKLEGFRLPEHILEFLAAKGGTWIESPSGVLDFTRKKIRLRIQDVQADVYLSIQLRMSENRQDRAYRLLLGTSVAKEFRNFLERVKTLDDYQYEGLLSALGQETAVTQPTYSLETKSRREFNFMLERMINALTEFIVPE